MRTYVAAKVLVLSLTILLSACGSQGGDVGAAGSTTTAGCPPYNSNTGEAQELVAGICVTRETEPPVTTTATTTAPTTATTLTPSYPRTPDEAAAVFGIPGQSANIQRVGQSGWQVNLGVQLKLYPGLCVDFDLNANPAEVITGETEFVDVDARMHRALMKSEGSILGGATVYWSTCNRL